MCYNANPPIVAAFQDSQMMFEVKEKVKVPICSAWKQSTNTLLQVGLTAPTQLFRKGNGRHLTGSRGLAASKPQQPTHP